MKIKVVIYSENKQYNSRLHEYYKEKIKNRNQEMELEIFDEFQAANSWLKSDTADIFLVDDSITINPVDYPNLLCAYLSNAAAENMRGLAAIKKYQKPAALFEEIENIYQKQSKINLFQGGLESNMEQGKMVQVTTDMEKNKTYLSVRLGKDDKFDEFDYNMLCHNEITGLAPILCVEISGASYIIKYDITGKITLENILSDRVSKNIMITLLRNLAEHFQEIQEYMLEKRKLLLDYNNIFVDSNKLQVTFIYVPLESESGEEIDLNDFFKKLIFSVRYRTDEEVLYIVQLINYLNSNQQFSLEAFVKLVNEFDSEKEQTIQQKAVPHIIAASKKEDIKAIWNTEQDSSISQKEKGKKSQEIINDAAYQTGEKMSVSLSKELLDIDKNDNQGEEIVDRNENNVDKKTDGHDTGKEKKPYLVRVKTNEKIPIESSILKLGRSKKYCDYSIEENKTIGRSHADIIKTMEGYKIIDNMSRNCTYVNGKKVDSDRPTLLSHGAKICLSDEEFMFYLY